MPTSIKDISPKAVLLGAVADIVATNIVMIPVVIVVLSQVGTAGSSPAQHTAAFTAALSGNAWLYLTAMILGCAASVLGGWVAARIARKAELLNGALSSMACVGLGSYTAIRHPESVPAWQHAAFLVLSPCLGALGGAIWQRQAARLETAGLTTSDATDIAATAELRGAPRVVYIVNRVLIVLACVTLLFFGMVGLYGYSQHQTPVIIASVIFCALGLIAGGLLLVAGRRLRAGRPSHWAFHGGAVAVASFPVLIVLLALATHH